LAKLKAETKAQIRLALRHPVAWWRGADLPEENIRPWEGGIQFLADGLKYFMNDFTGMRNLLYLGMGEGKVPPNLKSIYDVIRITWDALTDPPVGVYMDRKRFGVTPHRWMMRANAVISPLLIMIQCFNFGLSPVQRVVQWTLMTMFHDLVSTGNAVSESKIWAGITPHSQQRGVLQLWKILGGHMGGMLGALPILLLGMTDVLGITEYQIMIFSALAAAPLTMFCRWLPSLARQRVDFSVRVNAEGAERQDGEAEEKLSFRESFAIVRHNRWFMMWLVVNLIRIVMPRTDERYLYRFLLPKMQFRGREYGGEVLYTLKGIFAGIPGFLLSPFAIQAVRLFGGPVSFIKGHVIINMLMRASVYLVGYKSWPRLAWMWFMEGVKWIFDMWGPVPHGIIGYEMFDYVEWKTGVRSEGMTKSVDGIINKLLKDNLTTVFGNFVTQWTRFQGYDVPAERQPERFIKSIWPLLHVGAFFGELIALIALLLYKTPHDPGLVEADLIERRALAKKMKEEAQLIG